MGIAREAEQTVKEISKMSNEEFSIRVQCVICGDIKASFPTFIKHEMCPCRGKYRALLKDKKGRKF